MPERGTLTAQQKVQAIMQALVARPVDRGSWFYFSDDDVTVTFVEPPTITDKGDISITVRASQGGVPLDIGDGIFIYRNPPIYKATRQADGKMGGYVRNPFNAFREVVRQTVMSRASRGF